MTHLAVLLAALALLAVQCRPADGAAALGRLNAYREAQGLAAAPEDLELAPLAYRRAAALAACDCLDGHSGLWPLLDAFPDRCAWRGEAAAWLSPPGAGDVVAMWAASPPHLPVLLHTRWTSAYVAAVANERATFYVALFCGG